MTAAEWSEDAATQSATLIQSLRIRSNTTAIGNSGCLEAGGLDVWSFAVPRARLDAASSTQGAHSVFLLERRLLSFYINTRRPPTGLLFPSLIASLTHSTCNKLFLSWRRPCLRQSMQQAVRFQLTLALPQTRRLLHTAPQHSALQPVWMLFQEQLRLQTSLPAPSPSP
jgi:hypothetical protein